MTYTSTTDSFGRSIVLDGAIEVARFKTAAEAAAEANALNAADRDLRAARRDVMATDEPEAVAEATARIEAAKARLNSAWEARAEHHRWEAGNRYMRLME